MSVMQTMVLLNEASTLAMPDRNVLRTLGLDDLLDRAIVPHDVGRCRRRGWNVPAGLAAAAAAAASFFDAFAGSRLGRALGSRNGCRPVRVRLPGLPLVLRLAVRLPLREPVFEDWFRRA
jgi:hypothetical protein